MTSCLSSFEASNPDVTWWLRVEAHKDVRIPTATANGTTFATETAMKQAGGTWAALKNFAEWE